MQNVWKIDGMKVDTTPQTIAGQLLAFVPDLQYRSLDAIRTLFIGLLDISLEMATIEKETKKGGERGALTRYVNSVSKQKRNIPTDRIKLLTFLYDHILQSEGLGLLQGFGFENSKVGNAERTSNVIQLYTNEKENTMSIKKKETTEAVKIKRSELINAAKELNTLLEPDPEIEVGAPSEELIPILVAAKELLEDGDKISAATQKVLDNLPKEVEPAGETAWAEAEEAEPEPEKEEPEATTEVAPEKEETPEPVKEKAPTGKPVTEAKGKTPATKGKTTTDKKRRYEYYKEILDSAPKSGLPKKEIIEKLQTLSGCSDTAAKHIVELYCTLLITMSFAEITKDMKFKLK